MSILVLVRHGQSEWNRDNLFTGWVDSPLTDKGRQEAKDAATEISDVDFGRLFTSTLSRAIETADIITEAIGQPHLPTARAWQINERYYGRLTGLNKAQTIEKHGAEQVKIWRRSFDIPPPGGEALADTAARSIPYFEADIKPHLVDGRNVLVVAHGNSLRSIVMHIEELSREEILEVELPTGHPKRYRFEHSKFEPL